MQDESTVAPSASADRVLHSDPHDFAGLYIRHRASFTLHARRYLRDGRDADEVVQEAFLRLFLALPELETELQALAYCRRTITNLCIDRFRAQARRPSLVDLDSAGAMDLAEDDPGDPVVRAEDAAMVRAALSLLSPLHRAALVKREIEEKPVPVIAAELEIPEESVKHVLFRARRALRRILASTSLAPGSDAEVAGTLGRAARASSGGMMAFVLLLVLGVGTGPDLRAIPVVGSDLPDLIPVTEIASAVGNAVSSVAGAVVEAGSAPAAPAGPDAGVRGGGGDTGSSGEADGPDAPVAGAAPDASPTPSPTALASAPRTGGPSAKPSPTATTSASPSPAPVGSARPSGMPTPTPPARSPEPEAAASASPEPSPKASPKPSPKTSPQPSPSPTPSNAARAGSSTSGSKARTKPKKSPSPTPSPAMSSSDGAWDTPGLVWVLNPESLELVLVPAGADYASE